MSITILTPAVEIGAFAAIAKSLAAGFTELGILVNVAYLEGPPPDELAGFPPGTRLTRIGGRSRTCPPTLARHLRRSRPSALISLGWILNPAAIAAVQLARTRTPVYLNEQSSLSYKSGVEHRDDLRLRSLAPLARRLYPLATAVTGASSDVVADLVDGIRLDPTKVRLHVVPNPVDVDRVRSLSLWPDATVTGPRPLFVNAARHVRQKNLPLLLRSFRAYVAAGGTGTLVLVGDGPETPRLKRLAQELGLTGRVVFRGHLLNPYPQIAEATAFVLSSEEEGFGLVLVEAMALGVPVIATNCPGGPGEILRGGQDGILVPPFNEDAMVSALHRVEEDAGLRQRLASAGRLRAEDFRPASIARMWLDLHASPSQPVKRQKERPDMPKSPRAVGIYHPRALHGDGGVTNSIWVWCESFLRAGYAVEVLHDGRLPAHAERRVTAPTVAVHHSGRGRWARPRALVEAMARPSILILNSGYHLANLWAAAVAARRGVPYVVVPYGAYDPHVRAARRLRRRLWEVAERRMLERAAAVHVFFSSEVKQVLAVAPRARVIVAPMPFEVADEQWNASQSGAYVAWIGRYDIHHKGLDRLLDAMAALPRAERPTLRLHGRDSKHTRLDVQAMVDERGLHDHVVVGPPIAGREKMDLLLGAAAYVHPSKWECHSVALLEAMSLGVPCLATSDINIASKLSELSSAAIVEGDVPSIAAGLRAAGFGELAVYGARGRDFLARDLNHRRAVEVWEEQLAAAVTVDTR